METPWGESDSESRFADGITFYTTPSHGGFLLSHERRQQMPETYRKRATFAGDNWYEEDCDAALVIASFPEFFTYEQVLAAKGRVNN